MTKKKPTLPTNGEVDGVAKSKLTMKIQIYPMEQDIRPLPTEKKGRFGRVRFPQLL